MTPESFESLKSQGYNRIPVAREVLADLDTPLSVYLKLVRGPYGYLFESVQGGEKWGRYSIIGLPCRTRLRVQGDQVSVETDGQVTELLQTPDPLAFVEEFKARYRVPELPGLPRFYGGLVGYFGYDTVAYIEPRLRNPDKPDPLGTPDILLMVSDEVVVFDNLSGRMFVVVHADVEAGHTLADAQARISSLHGMMQVGAPRHPTPPVARRSARRCGWRRAGRGRPPGGTARPAPARSATGTPPGSGRSG